MRQRARKKLQSLPLPPVLMLFGGTGGAVLSLIDSPRSIAAALPGSGCTIKGNISFDGGERIYHVPGQRYYRETRISPLHAERWFCSEAEARRAGWRRSRV